MTLPTMMSGVHLIGHGGLDQLVWREDLPVPRPAPGQVLVRIAAASVNNTDINTRIGWYSKTVRGATGDDAIGPATDVAGDGSWAGWPLKFPRIQGADGCGHIAAVGEGVDPSRIGDRVLIRALQIPPAATDPLATITFGSEQDGAFAQYAVAYDRDALSINSPLSDVELATFPCAYSTAEALIDRVGLGAERVLITGASGGVGAAAIQLAQRRGAEVAAVTSPEKAAALRDLGAAVTFGRDDPLPGQAFDVVLDLVGGPRWPSVLDSLRTGGRYGTSGAIAGPIVELDLRTLYLRDLTLYGSTHQPLHVFTNLVGYIEAGEIRPLLAQTYPLRDIAAAQQAFLDKRFIGKIGLQVA